MIKKTSLSEMDVVKSIKKTLKRNVKNFELKPHISGKQRIFITINKKVNKEALKVMLNDFKARLSTISGLDLGGTLGVIYHLALDKNGMIVNLKIPDIPRDDPEIDSVSGVIPAAVYMELEVHDLFGIKFLGNPLKRKWIVADDWPDGVYPLRKDYVVGE